MYGGHVMAEQSVYDRLIAKTLNEENMTDWEKAGSLCIHRRNGAVHFF